MNKPERKGTKVPILGAEEAVKYIPDGATIGFCGAGGGICEATEVINALANRYKETLEPKNLTYSTFAGQKD